jgi:hypothetical protein
MTSEEFRKRLREKMEENRKIFEGKFKDELNGLMGLSKEEIDAVTPGTIDLLMYDQLITVVKEATNANLAQAELKVQIEELGEIAIKIAKKVPKLSMLLA